MAHLLVVESQLDGRPSIQEVLESAGHKVTLLQSLSEVMPFLRQASDRIDIVALAVLQPGGPRSFDVVKEMCRIPEFRELGKVLVFPTMAQPDEQEKMYGAKGYASFEPQLHKTIAVNERTLFALNEVISVLQGG
jgi:CheY-like chemotaxis protein